MYASRSWVCTKKTITADNLDNKSGLFWKLFNYIQGENQDNLKIDMTVPVTTEIYGEPEVRAASLYRKNAYFLQNKTSKILNIFRV